MKEKIKELFSSITEALLGFGEYLRQRLDEHCREESVRSRLFILKLILQLGGIDDSTFDVLYKGKVNRKPKKPSLVFSILIAKEILGLTDREILCEARDNKELRTLLEIKDDKDVPCRKTLTRFRKRLRRHYNKTGVDLMEKTINSLIRAIDFTDCHTDAGQMVVFRIDSTPVEAFLRESNRMQLFYTTIRAFVKGLDKKKAPVPPELRHYLDKGEHNEWFYRKGGKELERMRWECLLEDLRLILAMDYGTRSVSAYHDILLRLADEQTRAGGDGSLRLKDPGEIPSGSLQSPFDPDATFRYKDGPHIGYAVNFVEMIALNEKGKIVARALVHHQLERNIHSDSQFLREFLADYGKPESPHYLVCDGAYYSEKNGSLARKKNFILLPTSLSGRKPDPFLAGFKLSPDGKAILECPASKSPRRQSCGKENGAIRASFDIDVCRNCPLKSQCAPKMNKRVAVKTLSQKGVNRAILYKEMGKAGYKALANIRNGVESVPSQLKNRYGINKIRQRGLFHAKMEGSLKILALAVTKLTNAWIDICYPEIQLL